MASMISSRWLAFGLIILSFVLGAYEYPSMPDRMATHWGLKGEANGYASKAAGLFMLPVLSLILLGFFVAIPYIDPLKQNIKRFIGYYDGFVLVFTVFLLYLHLLTILYNLGYLFNMTELLSPALGLLYYFVGVLIGKSKKNWFIGIRTPWTLSSDFVWEKTNGLGGKLFKIAGVISLLGIFSGNYALILVIVPMIVFSAYLVVYSFLEYRKEAAKAH